MRMKNYFHINGFTLSLALLVLSLASRGFSPGTPEIPSPQKPTLPNSNSIWDARTGVGTTRKLPIVVAFYLEQKLCLVPSSFLGFSTVATMQEAFPCAFAFLKIALPTVI